jgi:hypothetical protein
MGKEEDMADVFYEREKVLKDIENAEKVIELEKELVRELNARAKVLDLKLQQIKDRHGEIVETSIGSDDSVSARYKDEGIDRWTEE